MYQLPHLIIVLSLNLFTWSCWSAPFSTVAVNRSAVHPTLVGSPVIFGQGTYPRANSLSGPSLPPGSMIGTYTAFQNGSNILEVVLSTNKGASWQLVGEVTRGASNANDIDNPYILQLPSGRLLCAFRNHSKNPNTGAYTFFRITVTYSDDLGKTWKYLSTPSSDPGPVNGNWEPFLRNAQDGSLQLYYSSENSAADQDTLERFSTDGGKTWTKPQTISGAGRTARDGMTGVTAISGTNLIAVFESETVGTFSVQSITSTDDGKTWGNRKTVYTPSSPNTSAGAPQIVNAGGTLCVSFQTNEDSSLNAPLSAYTTKTAAKLITSGDGGLT